MTATHVSGIIMMDIQRDINRSHIVTSNDSAQEEGRPIIRTWGGCNMHDIEDIVERLEGTHEGNVPGCDKVPVALVGVP
jgi:hypothetical protein